MYKGIRRKKKKENLHDIKLAQTRCQNLSMSKINHFGYIFPYQKLVACSKSVVEMGNVS